MPNHGIDEFIIESELGAKTFVCSNFADDDLLKDYYIEICDRLSALYLRSHNTTAEIVLYDFYGLAPDTFVINRLKNTVTTSLVVI